jgi:hypothetical protein
MGTERQGSAPAFVNVAACGPPKRLRYEGAAVEDTIGSSRGSFCTGIQVRAEDGGNPSGLRHFGQREPRVPLRRNAPGQRPCATPRT